MRRRFANQWGFPKIGGTLLGVPIIWIILYNGLYEGPLNLGNYQISNIDLEKSSKEGISSRK